MRLIRTLAEANELGNGSTQVVDIGLIRERLGDRWPHRKEQVWDQVERVFRRLLGGSALIERNDETSFLVSQVGLSALQSQITCIRATSELMRFFIGAATPANVRISNVLGWSDGELLCAPLNERQLRSVMDSAAAGKGTRSTSIPIQTKLGRSLSVDLALTPLLRLRPDPMKIGHFARTSIFDADTEEPLDHQQRAELQPGDLVDLDCKILADTLELQAMSPKLTGSVVIPISYYSLANTSARYQLLQFVKSLPLAKRRNFLWELVDLEPGVPVGRLADLIQFVAKSCRGVICRLDLSKSAAETAGKMHTPLSVGPPDMPYTDYDLVKQESDILAALRYAPSVLLHDVPQAFTLAASVAGATHCTVID
jgi:hypothetical protein